MENIPSGDGHTFEKRNGAGLGARTIVFVESDAAMGGVQFSTLYLAQHLDRARWRPLVVCPEDGDLPHACRRSNVPLCILPRQRFVSSSLRLGRDWRLPNPLAWAWDGGVVSTAAWNLARLLARERPHLVVTKGLVSHFYGGLAARWLGIPCIWHVQDFISERFGGVYRRVVGEAARWLPSHIVADGTPIVRQLPEVVRARACVVFNGVDTQIFRPGLDGSGVRQELGIPSSAVVVGHVARMTPWKGQHHLLEAFAQVASEFPSAYLLLVGAPVFDNDSYQRFLHRRADELNLSERVVFAGYRQDLPQVLAAIDVFAYPAVEKDTSPLALISALAAGLPVVAFDIEGVREVVGEEAGCLVPVGQVASLAGALGRLLNQAGPRQAYAEAARKRAEQAFSLPSYLSLMEQVFLSQLNGR